MGMAILGPSPPYEYPINQLLRVDSQRIVHEGHVVEQEHVVLEIKMYSLML